MKPLRIDLGNDLVGWEYIYGNFVCIRKFDDGDKAYFFHTKWNGYHRRSYSVHVDKEDSGHKYRLNIRVTFKNDQSYEESIWARNRQELFVKARKQIKLMRSALRLLPF